MPSAGQEKPSTFLNRVVPVGYRLDEFPPGTRAFVGKNASKQETAMHWCQRDITRSAAVAVGYRHKLGVLQDVDLTFPRNKNTKSPDGRVSRKVCISFTGG